MTSTVPDPRDGAARWFYVCMAGICVAIAFGGYIPTYWSRLATGTFSGAPILHIHGMLFFAWTLFFLAQTTLVATGRTPNHRNWGMAGISLATAMGITVVLAAINSIKVAEGIGMGDAARRFSFVSLSALVMFAAFITLAIANVRRAELHRRFMLLARVPLMQAAMARLFMIAFAPADAMGPPPRLRSHSAGTVRRSADRRGHRLRLAHARTATPGLRRRRRDPRRGAAIERADRRERHLDVNCEVGRIAGGVIGDCASRAILSDGRYRIRSTLPSYPA